MASFVMGVFTHVAAAVVVELQVRVPDHHGILDGALSLPVDVIDVQNSSKPTAGEAGSLYSNLTSLAMETSSISGAGCPFP